MAFLHINDHGNKTQVLISKCTSDTIVQCVDNLKKLILSQISFSKGSVLRMEVNNLDKLALHEWDFDDTDDEVANKKFDEHINMIENEKAFVFSMDTSALGPSQACVSFSAAFKKAVKEKKLQLPTKYKNDVFVYALIDISASAYGNTLTIPIEGQFEIGIDRYADPAKYLKHADDLRRYGLSLNNTHEFDND